MVRIIFLLCLFFCISKGAFSAIAPPVVIEPNQSTYDLANHMEMYIDRTHQLTLQEVTDPSFSKRFIMYNFVEQSSAKNYDQSVWLRFRVVNDTSNDVQLFLTKNFPNQYTDWMLYKETSAGLVSVNFLPKTMHISLFPLDIPSHGSSVYYLYNYSEGWLQTTFQLVKPSLHLLQQIDLFFIMGIQYGIALALFFHSLFIYLFLRDKGYLLYSIFIVFAVLAYVFMDGFFNRFPMIVVSNWLYLHGYRFVMTLVGFTYVLFAQNILQTKQYVPRINVILNFHLFCAIPVAIIALLSSFSSSFIASLEIIIVTYYINFSFVLTSIAGFFVMLQGYKPAQYYIAGMVAIMAASLFHLAAYYRYITPNVFLFRLPQLGLDIDMILQAIALAVRFNLIQEAQIKTQKEVIKQKDLNVKLQEKAVRDKQRLIKAYARFFPRRFLELLKKKSILDIHLGDQTEKNMAVLFADLRNFTHLLEKKTPAESFSFINGYLNQIAPLIRKYDGVVDKYIGDAILALYEGPAEGAVYTAINIINVLNQMNKIQAEKMDMGIGIHYGTLMVGTIGEQERMDGTVISDTVNVASRLENLNKIYGTHIIISETVLDTLSNKDEFKIRFIDHIIVKGKSQSIRLYEIFDCDSKELIDKKLSTRAALYNAIQFFQEQEFEKALKIFEYCLDILPEDKMILLYAERCNMFAGQGHMDAWQPIAKLSDKVELTYESQITE